MPEKRGHTVGDYTINRMLGQLGDGERDGGRLFHAVPVGGGTHARALCGAKPGRRSVGWGDYVGSAVTCPHCLKKLPSKQEQHPDEARS